MDLVVEALRQASSQDATVLKAAEAKLAEWEVAPGFHFTLFSIFSNQNIEVNVRWLAIVYLKNGVDKYWRSSGKEVPGGLTPEEKQLVRDGLLNSLNEPVEQIASQLSVLTAKIARLDYPREWPQIIPKLVEGTKSNDVFFQYRCYRTLLNVIKILSSKRLPGSRYAFQEMAGEIYSTILDSWNKLSQSFINQHSTLDDRQKSELIGNFLLCLKILRILTVNGFKNPSESADVNHFLKLLYEHIRTFLELRKSTSGSLVETLEKYSINLMKVLHAMLDNYPQYFVDYIEPSLKLCIFYAFTPEGEPYLFEEFLIQNLIMMKNILICNEYVPSKKPVSDTKNAASIAAVKIKQSLFTPETVVTICYKLITQYFLLTSADLQAWDSDPEGYVADMDKQSWKYSLRPCTETLFHAMILEFGSVINPVLVELVNVNHPLAHPDDMNAILRKDAVYSAIGLAAFELYDEINFNDWFTKSLVLELKVKDPNYRIIRRRVAWLIGYWVSVQLSAENRSTLYESMLPLLQPNEDMVVRLTAANTIKLAVDDFGFNADEFLKYLEPLFSLLFQLLKDCQECDSKMQVLSVLSFIAGRVGSAIEPFHDSLVQYLSFLWEESSNYNLLRCAIVSALVRLMQIFASSQNLPWSFFLSVIEFCTNINKDDHVYLLPDGLDLWLAIVQNTSELNDGLLQLFKNMPPLLTEASTEHLKICLLIVQAYVILAPEQFLKVCGEKVVESLMYILTDLKTEGVVMVLRVYEMFLRVNPSLSMQLLTIVQPEIAGERKPALTIVFEGVYHCKETEYMAITMYLSIVSRVLLFSKEVFAEMMNLLSQHVNKSQEETLSIFLDKWLVKVNSVTVCNSLSGHGNRKLNGLALVSLLTSRSNIVLEKFPKIVRVITEILNDIVVRENDELLEIMVGERAESPLLSYESDTDTQHERRCNELASSNPLLKITLHQYFQLQLNELKTQTDPGMYSNLLQSIDSETYRQASEYVQF
ncbi:unnamed protein product [Bemisia tabaci]|uniref:Importin N-terminal domain-containing protein n=1 Tax=Bemisia tabaci TaxID=7038 RepID=A0A9P0F1P0_BEMTA|nr:PREDICTED: importin-11 [Bemisia tabaci]CAH0385174.1 unnamed protein product [Bemisia tabaci]